MHRLVFLVAALLVGGCLGAAPPSPSEPAASPAPDAPSAGRPAVVEEAPALASARIPSLAAPPQWQSGEWWRIRLTEHMSGQTFELTRVVAGVEGASYLVGMPHDGFVDAAMTLHLPGFGQVARDDLSYEIHDVAFAPLRFPLEADATWEASFEGSTLTATVREARGTSAVVELAGDGPHVLLTYDAAIGEVSHLVIDGYLEYEVLEHGYGHVGTVTVPHMHDVVFNTYRFAGVMLGREPAPPVETIRVDDTYERVSFALLAGSYIPDGATFTTGVFRERVTAPDGSTYEIVTTPADAPGEHVAFFGHADPGGDWTFEHAPVGGGYVIAEGIAYHVYDVELPGGHVRGEHAHTPEGR